MEEYKEFFRKLTKLGTRVHKISHCLGARDAWKWVRKNKWQAVGGKPVEQSLYGQVIGLVNKALVERLLEGHDIEFPYNMGLLRLSSLPARVALEDGEWNTNYRTDWVKTIRLRYEDEEARKKHLTVKRISRRIYFIRYMKYQSVFNNKRYYKFRTNRSLARKLGQVVAKGHKIVAEAAEWDGEPLS